MERIKKHIFHHLNKDDSLLKHGLIMFIGMMIANVLSYIFQLYMSRTLTPTDYGIISALFSVIYIFASATTSIQQTLTDFSSRYNSRGQQGKIRALFMDSLKFNFIITVVIIIGFVVFNSMIGSFLKIENLDLIKILGIFIGISFIASSFLGVVLGIQRFKDYAYYTIALSVFKLLFGVILVSLGFGVKGALSALIISGILSLMVFYYSTKKILSCPSMKNHYSKIFKFSIPVFFTLLNFNLLTNIDMILVKHFFDGITAGSYAAAAIVAKIILFASLPISLVMFPKISKLHEVKKDHGHLLKNALLYTSLISFGAAFVYWLIPGLITSIFFGAKYDIVGIIPLFGLMIALSTVVNLFYQYNLAIRKLRFIFFSSLTIVLEIVLICIYHTSLVQILWFIIIINTINLLFFIIYNSNALFGKSIVVN